MARIIVLILLAIPIFIYDIIVLSDKTLKKK